MDCPEIISLYEQNKKTSAAAKAEAKKETGKRGATDELSAPAKKKSVKKIQVEKIGFQTSGKISFGIIKRFSEPYSSFELFRPPL